MIQVKALVGSGDALTIDGLLRPNLGVKFQGVQSFGDPAREAIIYLDDTAVQADVDFVVATCAKFAQDTSSKIYPPVPPVSKPLATPVGGLASNSGAWPPVVQG